MLATAQDRFRVENVLHAIQWLTDNGSIYTVLETVIAVERSGLAPITTPVYSAESTGLAEAFRHTLRRD